MSPAALAAAYAAAEAAESVLLPPKTGSVTLGVIGVHFPLTKAVPAGHPVALGFPVLGVPLVLGKVNPFAAFR